MPAVVPFPSPAPASDWFTLRADASGRRATLDIRGQIGLPELLNDYGAEAAGTFADFERAVKALGDDVREIEMNVYSPGGDVFTALAMHDLLVRHSARVIGRVDGLAASAATVVLMAADEIEVPANAYFMIHNPLIGAYGDYRELESVLVRMKKWTRDMANLYTARLEDAGKGDRAELLDRVLSMMDAETYLTGEEAVEIGFADRVSSRIDLAACAGLASGSPLSMRVHHPDRMPAELRALIDSPAAATAAPPAPDPEHPTTPTAMAEDLSNEAETESPANVHPASPAQEPQPAASIAPAAADGEAAPVADVPEVIVYATTPAAEPEAPAPAPAAAADDSLVARLGEILDAKLAPLNEQLTAQKAEIDRLTALRANGVDPAAWGNAPAVGDSLREDSPEPAAIDFATARPESLISLGLKNIRRSHP